MKEKKRHNSNIGTNAGSHTDSTFVAESEADIRLLTKFVNKWSGHHHVAPDWRTSVRGQLVENTYNAAHRLVRAAHYEYERVEAVEVAAHVTISTDGIPLSGGLSAPYWDMLEILAGRPGLKIVSRYPLKVAQKATNTR